jgi:hypothetical protein
MKPKQTKAQRIAELERKLTEAQAQLVHLYHFASVDIAKASTERLSGSGVILTLTALGGQVIVPPVLIRNGLSAETIAALKADFVRSFEDATVFKPVGVKL